MFKTIIKKLKKRTAVFHQDKLIGWLDLEESTGLLWVLGKVQRTITIIETTRSASTLIPEVKGGRVVMTNIIVGVTVFFPPQ